MTSRPDRELLRELSSLRDLLAPPAGSGEPPPPPLAPAPLPAAPAPLLDIARIFDDEDDARAAPLPRFILQDADTAASGAAASGVATPGIATPGAACREALIETLVAARLRRLEAELREQLRGLDDATLRAWAEAGD